MTHVKHTNKLYVQNAGLLNITSGQVTSVVQKDSQTQNGESNLGNENILIGRDLNPYPANVENMVSS